MKKSLASLIIALAFVSSAQGAVVINAVETGGNVVFTGTGILSTLAWDQDWGTIDFAAVEPNQANIWVGETPAVNSFRFINPDYFTGPTNFGAGGELTRIVGPAETQTAVEPTTYSDSLSIVQYQYWLCQADTYRKLICSACRPTTT
jgi:hypothetical protein